LDEPVDGASQHRALADIEARVELGVGGLDVVQLEEHDRDRETVAINLADQRWSISSAPPQAVGSPWKSDGAHRLRIEAL